MCVRISDHPVLQTVEAETIGFTFNGKKLSGQKGEPIAAALLAAGVDVFRYTPRKNEPRGLFCGIGQCNDCLVIVNGKPNVRSCVTPLEEGMAILEQQGLGRFGKL